MPDRRSHRGAHPKDRALFSAGAVPVLRAATLDLSWLLSRGYAEAAALALVGDRHRLTRRQRNAIRRTSCADSVLRVRRSRMVPATAYPRSLVLDGFNVLITVEGAIGGAVVLGARDGCFRDLAGLRGTYRIVEETVPAVEAIGRTLHDAGVSDVTWLLDRPVSNSGRLASLLRETAGVRWRWNCILTEETDKLLQSSNEVIATADSGILDGSVRWANLARLVVTREVPEAWVVDIADEGD